jgi:hypothetical protein
MRSIQCPHNSRSDPSRSFLEVRYSVAQTLKVMPASPSMPRCCEKRMRLVRQENRIDRVSPAGPGTAILKPIPWILVVTPSQTWNTLADGSGGHLRPRPLQENISLWLKLKTPCSFINSEDTSHRFSVARFRAAQLEPAGELGAKLVSLTA